MADTSTRERFRRNASGIASTVVTGTWLAALLLGFDWWLGFMLFGYIVIVPVVSMLFDEEEESEWVDDDPSTEWETNRETGRERGREGGRSPIGDRSGDREPGDTADALDRLRARYAEGDLTDEQFERKLDRLLETETPEDAAEYADRARAEREASDAGGDTNRVVDRDAERERDL
ncbi:hypothetical protein CK500_04325 [Halorubrum salipaludis]|uniref:SHOCT domain-containing protein n=1 Tax=Halorubrum salipaludis TaxID=2032630 RepID=A0A2A2FJJ1_9EURY|nr:MULTISPECIES: SHOCT domain-containing protein [Halorubrum]PAU84749.1 hypothetical protein CK500_04325 [Halorubrum salipaludis]